MSEVRQTGLPSEPVEAKELQSEIPRQRARRCYVAEAFSPGSGIFCAAAAMMASSLTGILGDVSTLHVPYGVKTKNLTGGQTRNLMIRIFFC